MTLFYRLQRYARSPGRNPREDRLTEALCAILVAAPTAASSLVEKLFELPEHSLPDTPSASTQRHFDRGRIDLELLFGSPARLTVWFENKVDSPAYADQGRRYLSELESRDGQSLFAWIVKAGENVTGERPPNARVCTWQDVAGALNTWLDDVPSGHRHEHGPWLVSEFLAHLEKEEDLAFVEPFETGDALALNRFRQAGGRLQQLLDQAKGFVEDDWGRDPGCDEDWPTRPLLADFHQTLPLTKRDGLQSPWPESCWFEWHGRPDDARPSPDGQWVIGAGVTFPVEAAPGESFSEFFEQLEALRFETGQGGHRNAYVYTFRYLTLDDLAQRQDGRNLGEQAQDLANWVVEALTELNGLTLPDGLSAVPDQ